MDVFDLRGNLVSDYRDYVRSFIKIRDPQIERFVDGILDGEGFWPEPLLQLNPTFKPGGTIDDLVDEGALHPECARIFRIDKSETDHRGRQLLLHQHQRDAIRKAKEGRSYVLTTGTGSGKSLAYIVPIVDHVLRNGSGRGIQAIVVYPMNALANSQDEELGKFINRGYPEGEARVRFKRFTGQENRDARDAIRADPPDILLTNYMMLELLLTRSEDRELVRAARGLKFLVFDELHTYRGRQGADVAMLIRRCRHAFGNDILCVGTSATMASGGSSDEQKLEVAKVSQSLFGVAFSPDQVVSETLERATPEIDLAGPPPPVREYIRDAVASDDAPPTDYEAFRGHPLASWIESTFGVRQEAGTGRLLRQVPRRLEGELLDGRPSAAEALSELVGLDSERCARVLRNWLLQGSNLRRTEASRFPIFAFRLHQFLTRGDTVWASLEPAPHRHLEIAKKAAKPGEPEKPLFPLVFCRRCGTEYYRVRILKDEQGDVLLPREDRRELDSDDGEDGYLHLSEESPWPHTTGAELLERLPDAFKETTERGVERVRPDARKDLPRPVFAGPDGRVVAEGEGEGARERETARRPPSSAATSCSAWSRPAASRTREASGPNASSWRRSGSTTEAPPPRSSRSAPSSKCRAIGISPPRPGSSSASPTTARTPPCRRVTSTTLHRSPCFAPHCTGHASAPCPSGSVTATSPAPSSMPCTRASTISRRTRKSAARRGRARRTPCGGCSSTSSTATSNAAGG